ncbi:hypothetical protein U1Q18_024320 [Sarracenia purpurea var. burkii]
MTTYGTFPTSSSPEGTRLQFISHTEERLKSGLGARRPWKEMFNFRLIGFPIGWISGQPRRRDRMDQNEPRLLPHELHHRRASNPFSEPSVVPYLAI